MFSGFDAKLLLSVKSGEILWRLISCNSVFLMNTG